VFASVRCWTIKKAPTVRPGLSHIGAATFAVPPRTRAKAISDRTVTSPPKQNRQGLMRNHTNPIYAELLARPQATYSLHAGRSRKPSIKVVPDASGLYRIEWPDVGPSPPANLARCMDAAQRWAERSALSDDRKSNAARRLKSLHNFSWSRSSVRPNSGNGPKYPDADFNVPELGAAP
jgi:hypothetical protein